LGIKANINQDWDTIFRIASGSADPVSTNQTLDSSFSSKAIWLDLAYFAFHPGSITNLKVFGGKMKNPFYTLKGISRHIFWLTGLRALPIKKTIVKNVCWLRK